MIEVVLSDGMRRKLADAEVLFSWGPIADADYTLDEVKALLVYEPKVTTMAGLLRGNMPIMGMAFEDEVTGLRIEIPMPIGFANDFGQQIVRETDRFATQVRLADNNGRRALQRYQSLPADTPPPPGE